MKKRSIVYNLINIIVLLMAASFFALNYWHHGVLSQTGVDTIAIITVTAVIVHSLKAFRLYLALYGADISAGTYVKTYCKVTPVSILLPFKMGELFRMYCYGYVTGNMLKGVVTVILDRFMDTVALVIMIVVVWIVNGGVIMPLMYVLCMFLIGAALLFAAFPGLYSYWKRFLLSADATPRKNRALKNLDRLNRVYKEMVAVTKGRGMILFALSLVAWTVEIASVVLLDRRLDAYLSSALSDSQSFELKQFVFISIILSIGLYLIIKAKEELK